MCFSATASFVAGGGLLGLGALTTNKAGLTRQLPLGLIPVAFGVQQLLEGGVWVSLERHQAHAAQLFATGFLLCSQGLWPTLIPLAVLMAEPRGRRGRAWQHRMLHATLIVGMSVSGYLLYSLIEHPGVAQVWHHSIQYTFPHAGNGGAIGWYLLATCLSGMLSSRCWLRRFGAMAFGLAVLTYTVKAETFGSGWCFYAAFLSLLIAAELYWPATAEVTEPAARLRNRAGELEPGTSQRT